MTTPRIGIRNLAIPLLLAALAFGGSTLSAADHEPSFHFNVEPLDFEALFTDVDTNSSKFEEYRDMDSGAIVRRLRLLGESTDRNRTMDFDILNAGRADSRYTLRYRNSGAYSILLDYNTIPHRFGNDGVMLHTNAKGRQYYSLSNSTQQMLQDDVEAFFGGAGAIDYVFLGDLLQPYIASPILVSPELERRRARAVAEVGKMSRWSWKIDLRQETRDGSRPYGASFGFSNAIELPEPVRYNTTSGEVSGEWLAKRGGLRFGVNVSEFENSYEWMTYDNPWRRTDSTDSSAYSSPGARSIGGPSVGRNALSPDNSAGQLFVGGHARLGQSGWIDGNLSFGRMEQDSTLLPHTINSAINPSVTDPAIRPPFDASDPASLPRATADTSVDIVHFTANGGGKLARWASVKVRARYYDYDNGSTPMKIPGYVRMDAVWEEVPRVTVPYAYTHSKVGAEFGFDAAKRTHVAVGYDLVHWDRDYREVDSSDDDVYHVTVDSRAFKNIVLRAGWEHADREADSYDVAAQLASFTEEDESVNNQFGLRKYDEADRTYDDARASASFAFAKAINLTLGARQRNTDYDKTVLVPDPDDPDPTNPTLDFVTKDAMGLLSEDLSQFDAEVSYTPGERLTLFVFGSRTDRETFQRARQSGGTLSTNPLDTWELTLTEVTDTWGLGLDARPAEHWEVRVSGSLSDADGDSDFFSPPGGTPDEAVSFPEYDDNKWLVYTAGFVFHVNDNVQTGLRLQHDEFETNRFARNGQQPYLPGALILDLDDGDYDADLLMVDLRVRF